MKQDATYNSQGYFVLLSLSFLACTCAALYFSIYWLAAIPFLLLFLYAGWQQWEFIFFLLIFSLPWSVEYNFNPGLGTDLPDEPLMLLTAALFVAILAYRPGTTAKTWNHPLIFLLILHFCWITVTVLFSTSLLISFKFLLAKSWYLLAFVFAPLYILKNKRAVGLMATLFVTSMLAVTIIALYRHYKLGFSFATINAAVSPFFRNHVNYSAMLVCTVPVLVAIFQLKKKLRPIILAALLIIILATLLSYARGAWLALLVAVVSYWLMARKKLFVAFVMGVALLIAALIWIKSNDRYLQYANDFKTTIFHKDFREHLAATYQLKDVSTAERFNRWVGGVRMIKDNWIVGCGPNTFYYNYKPYTIPAFKTWVSDNKEHSTVHNYFLLTTVEQGVFGLLFFMLLLGAMTWYAQHLYTRITDRFYKTTVLACGVMIMMIVAVNFLSDLIETDKVGSLFFLCLTILVVSDKNTSGEEAQHRQLDPPPHI